MQSCTNRNNRLLHSICQFVSVTNHVEVINMTRIGKWGHSGAIRINANVLECAGLCVGDDVLVRALDDGSLLVIPAKKRSGAVVSLGSNSNRAPAREPEEKW